MARWLTVFFLRDDDSCCLVQLTDSVNRSSLLRVVMCDTCKVGAKKTGGPKDSAIGVKRLPCPKDNFCQKCSLGLETSIKPPHIRKRMEFGGTQMSMGKCCCSQQLLTRVEQKTVAGVTQEFIFLAETREVHQPCARTHRGRCRRNVVADGSLAGIRKQACEWYLFNWILLCGSLATVVTSKAEMYRLHQRVMTPCTEGLCRFHVRGSTR